MDGAAYRELLRPLFAGRPVILAGQVIAAWTSIVTLVRDLGAADVLVIGTEGAGSGPLPDDDKAILLALAAQRSTSVMDSIRAGLARLHDPPSEVVDTVRRFDPHRGALVLGDFLGTAAELDGRPYLAYRRPEWVALEDKMVADPLWDRAGVARAPSLVVPAERSGLLDASQQLSSGNGTVWSGDTREGFNGGAEYVRWVRTPGEEDAAVEFFREHCDRARVMPFLEGIPCSIHGIVFPDHLAASRPVEMVTLRRPADSGTSGFFYAGCASLYDPPPDVRSYMRDVARRVGATLRDDVAFRGAFTVDGVVDDGRFLPTELNPRMGAGLNVVARGLPELPIQLLMDALVGGVDLGYDPVQFEADLVAAADSHRSGGTWKALSSTVQERIDVPLAFTHGRWHWAPDTVQAVGKLTTGPSGIGAFIRCGFDGAQTPVGRSVGPRAAAFWAFADRELGTSVGPLTAAAT